MNMLNTAVILAAGEGKRMCSDTPKMLHTLCGRPLVGWAVSAAAPIVSEPPVVVIGHRAEEVKEALGDSVRYAYQREQHGSGHALMCARELLEGKPGYVLVLAGDMPLFRQETLAQLSEIDCAAAILTIDLADPTGYGRVIRNAEGNAIAIVEHRDATPAQREIHEVNISAYCFDIQKLLGCLDKLTCNNDQGEYYITDCIELLAQAGETVRAIKIPTEEGMGVNDRVQLAACTKVLQKRINEAHMRAGVTMPDPDAVYIEHSVKIGRDCTVWPGVVLRGNTKIDEHTELLPACRITDSHIGSFCQLAGVIAQDAVVGNNVKIGPYVNLRPGTQIADGCKIGDFVEIKNTVVGEGTKLPHLSYFGDGEIGARVNAGCGTVFANYDGFKKSRTKIGNDVFLGCHTLLVPPVTVGDGAFTAAGSVITEDIPAGGFAIARSKQVTKQDYVENMKNRLRNEKK
ncbi:MAG: bifunctional UDP-N-acetylglucosamine diphosphorylase/glucosamine-1-phosphate N-acetyltransferase GlmU [Eubacteriales bacterium]|nr:bifunctional UDP-N-acetylglucosamine diphosphorylase/glucosamine-1-phosphate N-acetyltransferase GlmU [Eubacteriales bacterium]